MSPENAQLFERLAVALAIGLLIGLERGWEYRTLPEGGRVAGIRTFGLVSMFGAIAVQLGGPYHELFLSASILAVAMLMGVGMGLIDERDWGTLQRLRVSGAPIQSVLAGKLGCRFIVGLLQMILLLAVGRGLFGISLGRAPAMLLLPAAAIAFAAVAFSLVIACVARTHDSVMPIGAVTAMVMSAIGGCWWPLDFEPAWIRAFAQVLPTTWTMEAFNDLMIRQTPPSDVLWPCAIAAALGGLYLVVSMIGVSRLYE